MEGFVNVRKLRRPSDMDEIVVAMRRLALPTYAESLLVPGFHEHQYDDIFEPAEDPRGEALAALQALQQVHSDHMRRLADYKLDINKDCMVASALRHITAVARHNLIQRATHMLHQEASAMRPATASGAQCESCGSADPVLSKAVCEQCERFQEGMRLIGQRYVHYKQWITDFVNTGMQNDRQEEQEEITVQKQLQKLMMQLETMMATNNFRAISGVLDAASVCSQETNTQSTAWFDDSVTQKSRENIHRLQQNVRFLLEHISQQHVEAPESIDEVWEEAALSALQYISVSDTSLSASVTSSAGIQNKLGSAFFAEASAVRRKNIETFWTEMFAVNTIDEVIDKLETPERKKLIHGRTKRKEDWLLRVLTAETDGSDVVDKLRQTSEKIGFGHFMLTPLGQRFRTLWEEAHIEQNQRENPYMTCLYFLNKDYDDGREKMRIAKSLLPQMFGVVFDVPTPHELLQESPQYWVHHLTNLAFRSVLAGSYTVTSADEEDTPEPTTAEGKIWQDLKKQLLDNHTFSALWNSGDEATQSLLMPHLYYWTTETLKVWGSPDMLPAQLRYYVEGGTGIENAKLTDLRLPLFDPNNELTAIMQRSMMVHAGAEVMSLLLKEYPRLAVDGLQLDLMFDRARNDFFSEFCFLISTHHRLSNRYNGTRLTFEKDSKHLVRSFRCTKLVFRHARVERVETEKSSVCYLLDARNCASDNSHRAKQASDALKTHPCYLCNVGTLWRQAVKQLEPGKDKGGTNYRKRIV